MEMGHREYARHRGVTLGAVQKAIKAERISLNENGKIDSVAADLAWEANTDSSRVAVNVLQAPAVPMIQLPLVSTPEAAEDAASPPATDEKDPADELTGTDKSANDYRESRATRERFNALKQQLEYEQLVGQLINVDEANRIAFTFFRALRDSVMNVATRIKDQLAAESDSHACEQLVENEISAALAGIDVTKLLTEQDE
jgi:hypothetical protein